MSLDVLCPRCRARLDAALVCTSCRQEHPRLGSVGVLLSQPDVQVETFRKQLGLVIQQGIGSAQTLQTQGADASFSAATRMRLLGLAHAILEQVEDLVHVLGPALGGQLAPDGQVPFPRGALDYLSYLHRDWAWHEGEEEGEGEGAGAGAGEAGEEQGKSSDGREEGGGRAARAKGDPNSENALALAAIRRVTHGRNVGRTLVLGGGACRLAYDLHVHCGGTETAVVDIDPFLLLVAEAVIRGGAVPLTETSVNAPEVDPVSRRWLLRAPAGPLGPEVFHLFLADGLDPPFGKASFDTVLTPWFIDQVPTDLEALLRTIHGLLAPGGRWINQGPLIYPPDQLPIARWYSRREIFELAEAVGFRMGDWESASMPGTLSPLTGRGKIETVLTFEALRS